MLTQTTTTVTSQSSRQDVVFFGIGWTIFLALIVGLGFALTQRPNTSYDFRSFYASGYMLRAVPTQLYDLDSQKRVQDTLISREDIPLPFAHPPLEALLYVPFSFLRYRAAYLTYIAFNTLLLAGIFFVLRRAVVSGFDQLPPVWGLLLFFFAPVIVTLVQGQDSILFLLLCSCVWLQLQRGNDALAGMLLALCLFRFQVALPLAVLITIRRGKRFGTGFAITTIGVALLCLSLVGRSGISSMGRLMSSFSLSGDQSSTAQRAMAVHPLAMPNLTGLLYELGASHLSAHTAFAIGITVALALFLWTAFRVRALSSLSAAFAVAILCSMMVSQHLYLHDATLLLLPLALLAQKSSAAITTVCFCLPAVLFFLAGPNWFFLMALPMLFLLFQTLRWRPANS